MNRVSEHTRIGIHFPLDRRGKMLYGAKVIGGRDSRWLDRVLAPSREWSSRFSQPPKVIVRAEASAKFSQMLVFCLRRTRADSRDRIKLVKKIQFFPNFKASNPLGLLQKYFRRYFRGHFTTL